MEKQGMVAYFTTMGASSGSDPAVVRAALVNRGPNSGIAHRSQGKIKKTVPKRSWESDQVYDGVDLRGEACHCEDSFGYDEYLEQELGPRPNALGEIAGVWLC
jgi:hypothetical protein